MIQLVDAEFDYFSPNNRVEALEVFRTANNIMWEVHGNSMLPPTEMPADEYEKGYDFSSNSPTLMGSVANTPANLSAS
jgi:hypothetical protein